MLKLFGFSKKEKVTVKDLASVYSRTLFEVIDLGFSEIIEFVNDNRKFEESPNLKVDDANWFLMIVFAANNHCLPSFFDDHIVHRLHHASLNELIKFMDLEEDLVRDMFIDYENFFKEQYSEDITIEKAMAKSIFVKYNLNEYQGDLLFQIPIDVTKQFMAKLATLKTSKKKIFIVSYPHPIIPKILNRFKVNGWTNLYDARDDWEEFQKVGQAKWYNRGIEKYIVRNCDHVTAVSWPLGNKLNEYDPLSEVQVVPNALSPNFLSKNYSWKGSSQVKVGYFGHLTSSWFDWDALIEIAKIRPNYHFEIIGHSAPDDLKLPSNIDLMGPKNHPQINEIAADWRVAIIPFKPGLLADAVDPIKIYEYMALNLPTVSFRMPQIDSYPYTITVDNNEDFAVALDEFVRYRPKKGALKKWLATNTWGDRVDDLLELSNRPRNDGLAHLGVEK